MSLSMRNQRGFIQVFDRKDATQIRMQRRDCRIYDQTVEYEHHRILDTGSGLGHDTATLEAKLKVDTGHGFKKRISRSNSVDDMVDTKVFIGLPMSSLKPMLAIERPFGASSATRWLALSLFVCGRAKS